MKKIACWSVVAFIALVLYGNISYAYYALLANICEHGTIQTTAEYIVTFGLV